MFDGIGMGLGFTIALTLLGAVREFLGTGKIFDLTIMPEEMECWYSYWLRVLSSLWDTSLQ